MKEAMLKEVEPMPPQEWPVAVPARVGGLDAPAQAVPPTKPVDYLDRVQFERFAALIATDSGGVRRKAFFHQVPCVTLRAETEWVELVEGAESAGSARGFRTSGGSDSCRVPYQREELLTLRTGNCLAINWSKFGKNLVIRDVHENE